MNSKSFNSAAGLISDWGIKKFNLDELYVRFFRLAERCISENTGKGVVCYISNFSYLGDPSFVVMRQRFLQEFDRLWFDCLNGDSRETGKLTPEGNPDPSVFSTQYNKEGIRVGTTIGLMVRKEVRNKNVDVYFRHFWGVAKREQLLDSLNNQDFDALYQVSNPEQSNRYSFRPSDVSSHYLAWQLTTIYPTNFEPLLTFNAWIIIILGGSGSNAGMLLHQIKTDTGGLQLRASHGRDSHPIAGGLAQIFRRRSHSAVFLGQVAHDIIHRLKHALMVARLPGGEGHQIIAGARLRLGIDGQQDLVAVGCYGIHLHINAIGLAPFGAKLAHDHIAIGHPMVPEAAAQRPARALGMDHGGRKNARRCHPSAGAQ